MRVHSVLAPTILLSTSFVNGIELITHEVRTENGIHFPIFKKTSSSLRRRGTLKGAIGLGDYVDVTYNVLVNINGVSSPLVLDTGSSDLWVISDACVTCSKNVQLYPQASFQSIGLEAQLLYGDSRTGTHAFGLIGKDTVSIAGLSLPDQYFAAINNTNTSVEDTGSAGIFGLGFAVNSVIWTNIFIEEQKANTPASNGRREIDDGPVDFHRSRFPDLSKLWPAVSGHRSRLDFPNVASLHSESFTAKSNHGVRQSQTTATSTFSQAIADSYARTAPLLSRLVAKNELVVPQFSVTLQRDTVDVGGNIGILSVGELPKGVKNETLTWVPLRGYTSEEGGLPAPPDSPKELYPIAWEVFIDDVYLDGVKLARSTLSSPTIALSALVDTGNSLIRGPSDVVRAINSKLGTRFPCNEPHTLAFQIGGKMFPIDPRDFISQEFVDNVGTCSATLVSTDPPAPGGYLYSWSLGDPFLKSVLSAYYYGNLTYPSRDPPRMGFLSTVPSDAGEQLKAAVSAAKADGNFPALSEIAPTGVPTAVISVSKSSPSGKPSKGNPAFRVETTIWALGLSSIAVLISLAVL